MSRSELNTSLREAERSDAYMVAVWRVENGRVVLFRYTRNFPFADLDGAVELLRENLDEMRA